MLKESLPLSAQSSYFPPLVVPYKTVVRGRAFQAAGHVQRKGYERGLLQGECNCCDSWALTQLVFRPELYLDAWFRTYVLPAYDPNENTTKSRVYLSTSRGRGARVVCTRHTHTTLRKRVARRSVGEITNGTCWKTTLGMMSASTFIVDKTFFFPDDAPGFGVVNLQCSTRFLHL